MIKFILLATLLFSSSYAVDLATVASSDADTYTIKANRTTIESKEDVEKTQKYINKIPNDKCKVYIEDDNIKKDVNGKEYRFILDNFNYKTGYTKYNVYRQNSFGDIDQDKPLDTISFTNEQCRDDVVIDLWIDADAELFKTNLEKYGYNDILNKFQEIRDQDNTSSDFNKELRNLEQRYLKKGGEFTDTGNKKFLTTASYLLACLSFDEDVIDIKKSIELNKITLQDDYTIYPNSSAEDLALASNQNPRSRRANFDQTRKIQLESLHSISEYISENIVLFAFKFRVAIDPIILKLKGILLLIFLPSTVGLLALSKFSKRISGVSDFDDIPEKLVMGLFLFLAFYISDNGNKTVNAYGDEKAVSINFHQDKSALLFSSMMDIANETGNIFSSSYINFKRTSAGFSTDAEMNAIIKDILELNKQKELLISNDVNLIDTCSDTYDAHRLKLSFNLKNVNYPTRGQYDYWKENATFTESSQFYKTGYNSKTVLPPFTIQMCNQFERDLRDINKALEVNNEKLDATKLAFNNKYEQEQLLKIARIQYKASSEMGVIALPQIMSTNIVTDNLNMFGSSRENEKLLTYMQEQNEDEDLNDSQDSAYSFIFENLAYMVIPGASAIQDTSASIMKFSSSIITSVLGKFNFLINKALKGASELLGTVFAVIVTKSMIQYFPVVALSMASLMVISWYYVSVFVYFLVSPFIIVYAIATQQTDIIKNYIVRGIVLSFKPLLIIMSLMVALLAVYLINDLSIMMFEGNFSLLVDVVSNNNAVYSFTGFLMLFFKGLVLVGASVVGVISAFYLVYNGAEMILGMFGFKDMGVDVKETVGASVEARSGKFNTPSA